MQILHNLPAPFPPLPSEGPHHQAPAAAAIRRELTDANHDLQGALAILSQLGAAPDVTAQARELGLRLQRLIAEAMETAAALRAATRNSPAAYQ